MEKTGYDKMTEFINPAQDRSYKWVRSTSGWIAGVCQGLALSLGIPAWAARFLWIVGTIISIGAGVLVYIACVYCLPSVDRIEQAEKRKFLGVCWRLSIAFNMEVGLVRLITLLLGVASFGLTFIGYLILHFIVPSQPEPLR